MVKIGTPALFSLPRRRRSHRSTPFDRNFAYHWMKVTPDNPDLAGEIEAAELTGP